MIFLNIEIFALFQNFVTFQTYIPFFHFRVHSTSLSSNVYQIPLFLFLSPTKPHFHQLLPITSSSPLLASKPLRTLLPLISLCSSLLLQRGFLEIYHPYYQKKKNLKVTFDISYYLSDEYHDVLSKAISSSFYWRRGASFIRVRSVACSLLKKILPFVDLSVAIPLFITPFCSCIVSNENVECRFVAIDICDFLISSLITVPDEAVVPVIIEIAQSLSQLLSDTKQSIRIASLRPFKKAIIYLHSLQSSLPKSTSQMKDERELTEGKETEERYRKLSRPLGGFFVSDFSSLVRNLYVYAHDSNEEVADECRSVLMELVSIKKVDVESILIGESEFYREMFPDSTLYRTLLA
ncbi:hypothetical protein GEMRC1_012959 [Eukaryota sp. GEM-RC1]